MSEQGWFLVSIPITITLIVISTHIRDVFLAKYNSRTCDCDDDEDEEETKSE